jgi:hypothetical protein
VFSGSLVGFSFSFFLAALGLNFLLGRLSYLLINSASPLWVSRICGLVSNINFGDILNHCFFRCFFCFIFLLFWYSYYAYVPSFAAVFQFENILFYFFFNIFFSVFHFGSFGSFCLYVSQALKLFL